MIILDSFIFFRAKTLSELMTVIFYVRSGGTEPRSSSSLHLTVSLSASQSEVSPQSVTLGQKTGAETSQTHGETQLRLDLLLPTAINLSVIFLHF